GEYTVVAAQTETEVAHWDRGDPERIRESKRYIAEHLQTEGIEVTELVDRLYARNAKPVRLTLESSPKDGYVIDFDGQYAKYFEKNGGGWEEWHKEKPKAHGYTTVSLPAYDAKTGLVLVYRGTQYDWLAGAGSIILYRYEKGK